MSFKFILLIASLFNTVYWLIFTFYFVRLCICSWACLGQFLVGSLLFSPGSWCAEGFVCALQESVSPVLCKFWQLYGGISGDLLWEGLCHTQVCCTQSPCPCASPLLTHTSSGDIQTQFCLSLCWGPWVLVCTRLFKCKLYKCTNLGLVHLIWLSKRQWFNMFDFQGRISI